MKCNCFSPLHHRTSIELMKKVGWMDTFVRRTQAADFIWWKHQNKKRRAKLLSFEFYSSHQNDRSQRTYLHCSQSSRSVVHHLEYLSPECSLNTSWTTFSYSSQPDRFDCCIAHSRLGQNIQPINNHRRCAVPVSPSIRTVDQPLSIHLVLSMFTSDSALSNISLLLSTISSSLFKWLHFLSMDLWLVLSEYESLSTTRFSEWCLITISNPCCTVSFRCEISLQRFVRVRSTAVDH